MTSAETEGGGSRNAANLHANSIDLADVEEEGIKSLIYEDVIYEGPSGRNKA